ncbi:MAG: TetR/AcrR family transcriptional regulator [Oscillospiraceae bacterium]|nr:TetR/AcrR family transcriptional regulator [Oscillospiraceae bacterium]
MARKKVNNAIKMAMVRVANRMFLERGFSNTSVKAIAQELGISTGHITFYYPTKEHLLAILVEKLCDFQWQMMNQTVDEGKTSLMAICLELVAMAAICEENEIAKDFYLSSYTNPMCLEIIRRSDTRRAKEVFGEYCTGWNEEDFAEAETLVSGIEYATLMTTPASASLEVRIAGALNQIMTLYNVPADVRKMKIGKVLAMDYGNIGRRIFTEFTEYIDSENSQLPEE